jgi:hypothetical protein
MRFAAASIWVPDRVRRHRPVGRRHLGRAQGQLPHHPRDDAAGLPDRRPVGGLSRGIRAPEPLDRLIEVSINNLAAVPSIIFGLLGLAVFLNFMHLPRSAPLVGGLTLALMTMPVIVIAGRNAIKSVPPSIRDAALASVRRRCRSSSITSCRWRFPEF